MTHNTTVDQQTFDLLKGKQRHLIIKHNPLFMPCDTLTVSLEDTRDQLSFEIVTVDALHSRTDIIGLYAEYRNGYKENILNTGQLPPCSPDQLPPCYQAAPAPETEVRFH